MGKKLKQFNVSNIYATLFQNKGLTISVQKLYSDKRNDNRPTFTKGLYLNTAEIDKMIDVLKQVKHDLTTYDSTNKN